MTLNDLKLLIAKTLNIKEVDDQAEMGKTRGWDSLRQVQLMLALEREANIVVQPDLFGELVSVTAIAQFLTSEAVLTDA